jgi:beta-glucosidase
MPDFVAVNIYVPGMYVIASDQAQGYREVPMNVSHPAMRRNAVV